MSRTDIEIEITRSLVVKTVIGFSLFLGLILLLNRQSDKRLAEKFEKKYSHYSEDAGIDSIKMLLDTMQIMDSTNYRTLSNWIPTEANNYRVNTLWVKKNGQFYKVSKKYGRYYRFDGNSFDSLPNELDAIIKHSDTYQIKLDEFLNKGHGNLIVMIDSTEANRAFFESSVFYPDR